MSTDHGDLVARAGAAAAAIAPLAARIEAERRLPAEAVKALVDARVFKLAVPRALGGCLSHRRRFEPRLLDELKRERHRDEPPARLGRLLQLKRIDSA